MEKPRDPDELGALWIKSSSRGEYMTGTINGLQVVVFRNDRKAAGSNAPDWRVLKSKPREAGDQPRQRQAALLPDEDVPF